MSNSGLARLGSVTVFVLAVLLLLGAIFCIVASRNDMISYIQAFTWLGYIGRAGAALFIVAVVMFALSLLATRGGAAYSAVAAVLLAVMVGSMYVNQAAPPEGPLMNDITTDLDDPPRFEAVIPLRPANSNPVEYGGAETAANQRRVHPEVQPIETSLPPDRAFDRALEIGAAMGWDIVAQDPSTGVFEAVATTRFFRFKDDIVVRVRPASEGSRVDLRSHSRIGRSDLGKNAARIMEFRERFLADS